MPLDAFMARVRARCAPHRNGVGGYCLPCFLEENPWMKRSLRKKSLDSPGASLKHAA